MIANVYVPLWIFGVAFIAICLGPDVIELARRITSTSVGAAVEPQSSSLEQLTAGSTRRAGECICNPRWSPRMADADCPIHGLAALCRSINGVYDQEFYAHLHDLIDEIRA